MGAIPKTGSASSAALAEPVAAHDYLYSREELLEWKPRIEEIRQHGRGHVRFANNDVGGKSVANALQLREMLGDDRRFAPADLIARFPK